MMRCTLHRTRFRMLSAGLWLCLAGCTSPSTRVELYYPRQVPSHKYEIPVADSIPLQLPRLHVLPFEDLRPWSRVGENRTDWGFHVTVIEASNSVMNWFRDALAQSMGQMGYEIASLESADITLEGKLRELFVSRRFFYDAQLRMLLIARCSCHGKILVSREIEQFASLEGKIKSGHAEALAALMEQVGEFAAGALKHLESDNLHQAAPLELEARDATKLR